MSDARALDSLLRDARRGYQPTSAQAMELLVSANLPALLDAAAAIAHEGHGPVITYSRKVFIPVTRLCRDVCSYCTFADVPRRLPKPYMDLEEIVEVASAGEAAGCREALFTLGDQPEARYAAARRALAQLGHTRTLDYLQAAAREVLRRTTLLPHLNPGVMTLDDLRNLRPYAVSMGLMLESSSERLCLPGGPHYGSPDKAPGRRLAVLDAAGQLAISLTTGILIGIGETRTERIDSLLAIRELHRKYGHVQDLIIQNFCAKPGTRMAAAENPSLDEQLWTNAVARLLFGPEMSIQAPPNLRPTELPALLNSGINDWGGISPVTPDHVNPEAPWPAIAELERATAASGRLLVERLAITPAFARSAARWVDATMVPRVLRLVDATGHVREDSWFAGSGTTLPAVVKTWVHRELRRAPPSRVVARTLQQARAGSSLDEHQIVQLLDARGTDLHAVLATADEVRREAVGDAVGYVVTRNINYTNICSYRCGFCAFSKGRSATSLRGPGYRLDFDEVARRAVDAEERGATEVCLQGGIHPSYTGDTYLQILEAIKAAVPDIHIHAFSPLEIMHGARSLGLGLDDYLRRLQRAGLASLPGTAAEILVDDVRAVLCPDKLKSDEWLAVVSAAHRIGLPSTATIMFGHVDSPRDWARHLLQIRALQAQTGGFTEFVPLPFVHMEAPIWRRGGSRSGPTLREAVVVHAVARLVLHPLITHVQASWVKMGLDGLALCLEAGADDMGGTLMDESITRAAGGSHGQLVEPQTFEDIAGSLGRIAWQRTTLYRPAHVRQPHRQRSPGDLRQ
jgi:FO synthase